MGPVYIEISERWVGVLVDGWIKLGDHPGAESGEFLRR
jgi:hypothetical protein